MANPYHIHFLVSLSWFPCHVCGDHYDYLIFYNCIKPLFLSKIPDEQLYILHSKKIMIESSDIFEIMIYTNFQYSLCQSVLHRFIHYHCVFASLITSAIDPFHKSLDALDEYTTVQPMLIEMISVTKWCIVVYRTGAIWNLDNGCITGSSHLFVDSCIGANCRHKYFTEQIMLREKFTHRITLYEKNTGKGTRHPNWSHLLIVIQLTRSLEFRKLLRFILVPVPPTSIRSNSKSNEILEFFCS